MTKEELEEENVELKEKLNRYEHDCPSCSAFGKHCPHRVNGDPYFYDCYLTVTELEAENANLKIYNEKLLTSDIEKHNKIVELETQIEKMKCCENCAWWYRLPNGERDCAEVCENFENWSLRRKK